MEIMPFSGIIRAVLLLWSAADCTAFSTDSRCGRQQQHHQQRLCHRRRRCPPRVPFPEDDVYPLNCRGLYFANPAQSSSPSSKDDDDDDEKSDETLPPNDSSLSPETFVMTTTTTTVTSRRQGYRFGDLTRRLIGDQVNQLTGKDATKGETYEFGDLSRWIDGRIKARICDLTGKEGDNDYEWGDLTAWAIQQVSNTTRNFTGKETYEVGDLSKEVLRRVQRGEYDIQDVWLACRILLSAGLGCLTPVASVLPLRTLLNLVNVGLAQEVSGRLLEVLAGFLDRRVKHALTGNADYQLGDLTKARLQSAIGRFTGKETYEVGDITRAVQKLAVASSKQEGRSSSKGDATQTISMEEKSLKELEEWDAKFLKQKS